MGREDEIKEKKGRIQKRKKRNRREEERKGEGRRDKGQDIVGGGKVRSREV